MVMTMCSRLPNSISSSDGHLLASISLSSYLQEVSHSLLLVAVSVRPTLVILLCQRFITGSSRAFISVDV